MQVRGSRVGLALLATASIAFGACSSSASTPSPAATAAASAGGSAAASAAASGGASGDLTGQKVTVIATWTGDEQKAFM